MHHTLKGRARLALGWLRRHPVVVALWVAALTLMTIATARSDQGQAQARWALMLTVIAATTTIVSSIRHALMRTTQIVALFTEDVKRDGDGPKLRVVGDDDH